MISTLDVGTISGVEKFIQRAKNSYFMNIFQFQCLLGQNGLLVKVQRSGYRELQSICGRTNCLGAHLIESIHKVSSHFSFEREIISFKRDRG
jgi:hypothetical protein